mmetsp:Transcript_35758/g.57827  ORF Transcript_35758/g.57827 Transcript_35758/m.57827 type:complete len:473 (-) Transcript_35758:149-1567(-)
MSTKPPLIKETRHAQEDKQSRVTRYWPGKKPGYAPKDDDEADDFGEEVAPVHPAHRNRWDVKSSRGTVDRRLQRINESRADREAARREHRQIRQAEILSSGDEENEDSKRREGDEAGEDDEEGDEDDRNTSRRRPPRTEEGDKSDADEAEDDVDVARVQKDEGGGEGVVEDADDEEAVEKRRLRIREKLKQKQEVEEMPEEDEQEEEEEEEEEVEETDESDEEFGLRPLMKPVFVPKADRETIAERERLEMEEEALEVEKKKKLEERKKETRKIVETEIKKEEEIAKTKGKTKEDMPDDNDESNEAEEYELWKVREMKRIKRDREEREKVEKEAADIERRRNMSDAERREEDRKIKKPEPSRQKWNFLQKYYHKGAFFVTDEELGDSIYNRDYSAPTGDDMGDKSKLPKVMQVKHFGRSGRTKYTHLVDQDTTSWESPWMSNDPMRVKYNEKMAGVKGAKALERPTAKKKST